MQAAELVFPVSLSPVLGDATALPLALSVLAAGGIKNGAFFLRQLGVAFHYKICVSSPQQLNVHVCLSAMCVCVCVYTHMYMIPGSWALPPNYPQNIPPDAILVTVVILGTSYPPPPALT